MAAASPCLATQTVDLGTIKGLFPNGTHAADNQQILQFIFAIVPPCTTILVPRGAIYAHSGELVLNTADVAIEAEGTGSDPQLLSTDVYRSGEKCTNPGWQFDGPCLALIVTGDRDSLSDLVIANNQPSQNGIGHDPTQHGLVLQGDGQSVTNVTLQKSDWSGIETEGATNLYLNHPSFWNTVNTSLAFHSGPSGPSGNIFVQNPLFVNPGDDGICVETYINYRPLQHDIWVNGETYLNGGTTTAGHGAAVVGGENIVFTNFSISGAPAAAITVMDGTGFQDAGSNNVKFLSGTINNANTWSTGTYPTRIVQGALLVDSGTDAAGETIDGVDIENVTFNNTTPTANRQVGDFADPYAPADAPPPTNVTFKNFTFTGTEPGILFTYLTTPLGAFTTSGWKITNAAGTTTTLPDHPPGLPPAFP